MSPLDKPTGKVTDTVDPGDFGGSSTDGPGSSTGNVTGNMDMDNSGSSNTNGLGSSYSSLATFTTTSSETSASFVSTPSLTNRVPLLSPSDKSTGDVLGHVDMNYATHNAGLWWTGADYAVRPCVHDCGG